MLEAASRRPLPPRLSHLRPLAAASRHKLKSCTWRFPRGSRDMLLLQSPMARPPVERLFAIALYQRHLRITEPASSLPRLLNSWRLARTDPQRRQPVNRFALGISYIFFCICLGTGDSTLATLDMASGRNTPSAVVELADIDELRSEEPLDQTTRVRLMQPPARQGGSGWTDGSLPGTHPARTGCHYEGSRRAWH
jgi:hypothetical protein